MAEPTLKDVLHAIAKLDGKVDAQRTELKAEIAQVREDVNAHRTETAKGFAALDKELTGHADEVHRDVEDDIRAIHKGLVRANVRGIPKELPSQVRAKGERPSKPAKRRKAR
jgi:hypothetical protein